MGRVAYTDDVLLDEVARVARLVEGPVLTTAEFGKRARVCNSVTIRRRFGGWRATLERAGLGHMYAGPIEGRPWTIVHPFLSDEALLEEIRRVAGLVGKPVLSTACFDKYGRTSARTLYRRFGDWRTVLERAGVGHMYSGTVA